MISTNCWNEAYKLIANGEIEKAMELCSQEPCSSVLECQRFLGWQYYELKEFDKALNWFGKAADREDGEALFGIGSVYTARKDFQSAMPFFERSAIRGYPRGYQWVAALYQFGCGVPKDINQAIQYYQLGAAQGYVRAERSLIYLESKQGNIFIKIISLYRFIRLLLKTVKIMTHNVNDPRIADVPNAFGKITAP
jgi:TPR repeat protein